MFTGLVDGRGTVKSLERIGQGAKLAVACPGYFAESRVGDSIAINGCCLTIVQHGGETAVFEAVPETLSRTTLGRLGVGATVNLERALRAADRLGGHFVTGHIDCIGILMRRVDESRWSTCEFQIPAAYLRQVAPKGSIAIDGVSLTVVDVATDSFAVALIPHTLESTTLGSLREGDAVNLETDVLSKYIERQLAAYTA